MSDPIYNIPGNVSDILKHYLFAQNIYTLNRLVTMYEHEITKEELEEREELRAIYDAICLAIKHKTEGEE